MARIAGVDLPRNKRVVVALTYIYGIGESTAKKICKDAGISEDIRTNDLTPEDQEKLRSEVDKYKIPRIMLVLVRVQRENNLLNRRLS